MLDWPTSSPKITRMFGLRPPGRWPLRRAAAPGACCDRRNRLTVVTCRDVPQAPARRAALDRRSCPDWSLILSSSLIRYSLLTMRLRLLIDAAPLTDPSETDMAGRRIDRLGMTRRRPIAAAIVRRAEMRAALQDLARNADVGLAVDRSSPSSRPPRGLCGMQHAFGASASCFCDHQSDVHSQTLPIMS